MRGRAVGVVPRIIEVHEVRVVTQERQSEMLETPTVAPPQGKPGSVWKEICIRAVVVCIMLGSPVMVRQWLDKLASEKERKANSEDFAGVYERMPESNRNAFGVLVFNAAFNPFYGRVIDEDGEPIAGARIDTQIISADGKAALKHQTETSDSNGLFMVLCGAGKSLNMHLIKPGYLPLTNQTAVFCKDDAGYNVGVSSAARPLLIRMAALDKAPTPKNTATNEVGLSVK